MRWPGLTLALALCALPARGDDASDLQLQRALTPIDSSPQRADLVAIAGTEAEALASIIGFAQDPSVDVGVALRAIRALPQFCAGPCEGSAAHTAVRQVIAANRAAVTDGVSILRLRAGIEALGAMRTSALTDVGLLALPTDPLLLAHPSRDIRAATAHALRDLCRRDAASPPLRKRLSAEPTPQVELAITDALRDLDQCPP